MKTYRSYSSLETKRFGASLVKQLIRDKRQGKAKKTLVPRKTRDKGALVLALKGNLGSGKTTFAQGLLRGLGVRGRVNSPTFVLMKRFKLSNRGFKNAYHIDCYRVKKSAELSSLGLGEIFSDPKNIVLVEWPERLGRILPKNTLEIKFGHKKENERILTMRGF